MRAADADGGRLALARWGTGASFHEFELVFGDLSRHVVGGGYDPMLLGDRKVHADESALARYLEGVRPDLLPSPLLDRHPAQPDADRARGEANPSLADGDTTQQACAIHPLGDDRAAARRRLRVEAPAPTRRVVCVLTIESERALLTLRAKGLRVSKEIAGEPARSWPRSNSSGRPIHSSSRQRDIELPVRRLRAARGSSPALPSANEPRPDPAEAVASVRARRRAGWRTSSPSGITGCDPRIQLARGLPAQTDPTRILIPHASCPRRRPACGASSPADGRGSRSSTSAAVRCRSSAPACPASRSSSFPSTRSPASTTSCWTVTA